MPTRREKANAVRALAIDAIEKAKSGHPGAPLGMADIAESLWNKFLKHNPANPEWPDRDRFVLSNGHASSMLYAALHLSGYNLTMEQLKLFRQLGSRTPGHPERDASIGVEMTTGPLGQGIASAVGIALAEAMLAAKFNKPGYDIVDHYTYVFCGDGCLMEGVSHEACSLAGTWKLEKLIVLYDSNGVSIDGDTDPWFSEDTFQRFMSYGWHVIGPIDGHDSDAIDQAIENARKHKGQPSLIICKTHIGFGSPKTDTSASHGAPLGPEAVAKTKETLGWKEAPFVIPEEIYKEWDAKLKGAEAEKRWRDQFEEYKKKYPDLAKEFEDRIKEALPENWKETLSKMTKSLLAEGSPLATRQASAKCLDILAPNVPELIGGAADLSSSVGAKTPYSVPLNPENYQGNYLYYGAREFGMGAIMNGLAIHGGFIPYGGTFLSFSDQAKNAIRLSALMNLHVIWILTHDSISVGEDGPTHQPVEQIPALRLTPNLIVWRPCDNAETLAAWIYAMEEKRPVALVLTRQKLPQFDETADKEASILKGGYILLDSDGVPEIILISSGSEVQLAMDAAKELKKEGRKCRVVSLPSWEVFDSQDSAWRDKVLPPEVETRLAIESSSPDPWRKYVGLKGDVMGMDSFGASGPAGDLLKKFGFTVDNVVKKARALLAGRQ